MVFSYHDLHKEDICPICSKKKTIGFDLVRINHVVTIPPTFDIFARCDHCNLYYKLNSMHYFLALLLPWLLTLAFGTGAMFLYAVFFNTYISVFPVSVVFILYFLIDLLLFHFIATLIIIRLKVTNRYLDKQLKIIYKKKRN